jgi:hypothetical protein
MTTNAGASVAFLTRLFASRTEAPVFIASLANDKTNARVKPRQLITRDLEPIERFVEQWDQPERALYFCVSTIQPGKHQRSKETVAELTGLHADIDLKGVEATQAEVEQALRQLQMPPSCVNFSGHGFHCYWLFHEALAATPENIKRVEAALRRLAHVLAGDVSVCEVARLMRLPGTHNSKFGEWIEVTTVAERPSGYTLEELEEWLANATPVLQRRSKANGHGGENPWLAIAERLGFKPPIDVEQRLAAMTFQGANECAIHPTQLSVSAALLTRGTPVDDVVEMLLEATRAAAGGAGSAWDWGREESDIRDMCATWLVKHPAPEIAPDVPEPPPADAKAKEVGQRPIIQIKGGELPRMVHETADALIAAGFPIFVRGGMLVYPVSETVLAAGGRTTITAKLKQIVPDLALNWLAKAATFIKFDRRCNAWVATDPPHQLAQTLLTDEGEWPFPRVVGISANPVLRPDGSLSSAAGYDAPTQLYRVSDPSLRALAVAERPSRADAQAALKLLSDLLSGFVFASKTDRAVALSLILTAVARSGMPVAPLHLIRAHTPGTGKSHLVDTASAIATGRHCPVITIGKTPEESEKRALLRESVPIISLDNCSNDLEGELLCQLAERPSVRVRILGVSEAPEFECRSTVAATGNNIGPKGDMMRRTLTCNLVADVERPELRKFEFDPVARVLEDRAAYLEAAITILRAYRAAGSPSVCEPIGSYDRWSALVRAPLVWLGEADPTGSMEAAREEDTDLSNLRELFAQWQEHLANRGSITAFEISEVACEQDADRKPVRPEFRDLLVRIAGDRGNVSTRSLGRWLRRHEGRIVDGLKLSSLPVTQKKGVRQYHVRGLGADKLV